MIALITGASSGIGEELAKNLANRGFNLILTARRRERLVEIKQNIIKNHDVKVKILPYDLSRKEDCISLYNDVKNLNIDILINNAGFGLFGKFAETDLDRELEMIDVNIKAVHILTKFFFTGFLQKKLRLYSEYLFNSGIYGRSSYVDLLCKQELCFAVDSRNKRGIKACKN